MSESVDVGYATSIEELARRLNGEVKSIIAGNTWSYAVIVNEKSVILVKFSPRSKNQYMRGLIAIGNEDLNAVTRELEKVSKEVVRELLKKMAERYGINIEVK